MNFARKRSGTVSRRLQNTSTNFGARLEQPNCCVEGCRTQVNVALRRGQVLMSGEFLDSPRRRPAHRQMRAERVAQDVTPGFTFAFPGRATHHHLNHFQR